MISRKEKEIKASDFCCRFAYYNESTIDNNASAAAKHGNHTGESSGG